jgi:hypothetical protein
VAHRFEGRHHASHASRGDEAEVDAEDDQHDPDGDNDDEPGALRGEGSSHDETRHGESP